MKKLARNTLALGTATLIVTAGLSFSANGADATKSYSTGRFLTGSIGGTNLDAIAQLKGVTAANPGNAGPNTNPLSLTLLSTLPINIPGGLNLDLAKFLSASGAAGAVNQYAAAPTTGKATGASGLVNDSGAVLTPGSTVPTDAKVSLKSGPLAGINDNLVSADLLLGALSSSTSVDGGAASRAYKIGGLNLQLGVPLLGTLVNQLSTAVAPVTAANQITLSPAQLCPLIGNSLNVASATLLDTLTSLNLGGVATVIKPVLENPLLPISNVDLCNVNPLLQIVGGLTSGVVGDLVKVEVTGLGDLTTGIANFSSGGVDVNLSTGKITLDLAKILETAGADLNKLEPNQNILEYITSDLVSTKITKVLDKAVTDLVTNLGKVNIKVTFAGTVVPVQLSSLTGPLTPVLTQALTTATSAVNQIGQPIDALLAQLVPNLRSLVELTGNNQSVSKTPTLGTGTVQAGTFGAAAVGDYYRTSALKINVLSSTLNVDLAASEAAVVAAPATDQAAAAVAADDDDSDAPADNADSVADADANADANADADADNGDDSDTVADADAQADADVTTTLPSTGAPNLLPFWLLGIALLLFGGAVLVNEKRRLNAQV